MTKGAALQQFFGRFMTAYPSNAVPEDAVLPYLTYDAVFDAWGGGAVSLTVNMWFHTTSEAVPNAKALELSDALGIGGVDISSQTGASGAIKSIKDAINTVSSTRGDLGAIQNRLEHTQNNLSVMTENIQDAESTIRDTDVADEMMAYTKNNILVQSAQAMLAQANQVPQGVLQLLQ